MPQSPAPLVPSCAAEALEWADAGLAFLAAGGMAAGLTVAGQAAVLTGLERVRARSVAARSRALTAFIASGGPELDGQGSARTFPVKFICSTRSWV